MTGGTELDVHGFGGLCERKKKTLYMGGRKELSPASQPSCYWA
jgi:hypothetical protein